MSSKSKSILSTAIYNSGASHSAIQYDLAKELSFEIVNTDQTVIVSNGSILPVRHTNLKFTYNERDKSIDVEAMIIKKGHPLYLGENDMKRLGILHTYSTQI